MPFMGLLCLSAGSPAPQLRGSVLARAPLFLSQRTYYPHFTDEETGSEKLRNSLCYTAAQTGNQILEQAM